MGLAGQTNAAFTLEKEEEKGVDKKEKVSFENTTTRVCNINSG